jgi:hypothetical protein
MTWSVKVTIQNDTTYSIDVVNNDAGKLATIAPSQSYTWTTEDPNNANALKFWSTPNVYYMEGGLNFGPDAGVYSDRGWLPENDQSITLIGGANGYRWSQTTNGGSQVVPWDGFTLGGEINLYFNKA